MATRSRVRVLSANHSEDSLCTLPAGHSLDGDGVRLAETQVLGYLLLHDDGEQGKDLLMFPPTS